MKTRYLYYILLILGIMVIILTVCKKKEELPSVETKQVSNVWDASAEVLYKITSDGGAIVTERGVCWSLETNPDIALATRNIDGSGAGTSPPGTYVSFINGLISDKLYYVRAYANNSVGIAYGQELTFSTKQVSVIKGVTTKSVTNIGSSTAICGGSVADDGGASGIIRGVCWSENADPTIASFSTADTIGSYAFGSYTSIMTGLDPSTTYYVRAYASNQAGVTYGNQVTLITISDITDSEGKVYNTAQIGSQVWLQENLSTAKFNDGTQISLVTDQTQWDNITTPAYCWLDNDKATYANSNGALYNWYAVNTGKLCPSGWHVPSINEWTTLTEYISSEGIMPNNIWKPESLQWNDYQSTENSCLFWAYPCGIRDYLTGFEVTNPDDCDPTLMTARWWSSTGFSSSHAYSAFYHSQGFQNTGDMLTNGLSVRCIKD